MVNGIIVICTHSTTATQLYVNGELVSTGGAVTLDLADQTYEAFGCYSLDGTRTWNGKLRDFQLFNIILTSKQAGKIYIETYLE